MKYRTKVRELEAIRFDGTNRDEINKLTGWQFEVVKTPHTQNICSVVSLGTPWRLGRRGRWESQNTR